MKPHVIEKHMMLLQILLQYLTRRPGRVLGHAGTPDTGIVCRGQNDLFRGSHVANVELTGGSSAGAGSSESSSRYRISGDISRARPSFCSQT